MNKHQLPEQHGFYFDEEQRIRRRSSAQQQGIPPTRHGQQAMSDDSAFRRPASQLRHRPIGNMYVIPLTDGTEMHVTERELDELPEEYQNAAELITPQIAAPHQRRQPRPKVPLQGDTVYEMPPARQADTQGQKVLRKRRRVKHPLLYLGVGMLATLALWVLGSMIVSRVSNKLDDMTYGYPRTYQVDAAIGHNNDGPSNPSHFIFINLNRHVEVIEIPAGDPTKERVYIVTTLFGDGDEFTPVTGYFKDVNGDGRPDMIIQIQDSRTVFVNDNGTFRPLKPGEHVSI